MIGTGLFAGCAGWRPVREVPLDPPPEQYEQLLPAGLDAAAGDRWWTSFHDSTLNALLDSAFHNNLSFAQMLARHQQARAQLAIARASWFPVVNASAAYQRQGFVEDSGENPFAHGFDPSAQFAIDELWNAGLTTAYELDLWGKAYAGRQAAQANFQAGEEDLRAYMLSLSALVTRSWYGALTLRRQQELIDSTITTYQHNLDLIESRYQRGVAQSSDLYQARGALAGVRADAAANETRLAAAEHALSILLARYPESETTIDGCGLPTQLPAVAPVLPSKLVQCRPDVRAAYQRLVAADRTAAQAVAARFPSFSLSGGVNGRSVELQDALDPTNMVWSALGSVTMPVFQGGRLKAQADAAAAAWRGQVAAYKLAVLNAFRETEDALVSNSRLEEALRHRQDQADAARANLRLATDRYRRGVTDYLPVTIAQTAALGTQRSLIQARYELLDARVALATALGGGWMDDVLANVEINHHGDLSEVNDR